MSLLATRSSKLLLGCLSIMLLFSSLHEARGQATELFISEYAEGSSNNKYIEVYNGTGGPVNLVDYEIWRITNGGNWPEAIQALSGTLADGDIFVIANVSSVAGILTESDLNSSIAQWNGDDAVGLAKNGVLIDAVGENGSDPGSGWPVAGINNATQNGKLIRKASICSPNTNWSNSRGTNTSNSEWVVTVYSNDVLTVGAHTASCSGTTDPEPTNYPTLFSCTTQSDDEINLSWTDATGTDLPDGYLVKWSDVSYAAISNPTDLSDSNGPNSTTVNQGVESASVSGLDPNTQYFFKIWSYSNSGSSIDYKTSPAPPQTDCTTDNGPCFEESFDNNNAPTNSYDDDSFLGDQGTTWTYERARNPNSTYQITAASIGFDDSGNGFISTSWAGGVGTLSYDTRTYFTGGSANDRTIEVWINGTLRDSFTLTAFGTVFTRTINNINASGTVDVEFRSTGSRQLVLDNLSWTCFTGCAASHNITSFLPTSGPAGTLVTITGSGFTGATAASLSGISATSITVIDDNTVIVEIPENATSGSIGITVAGCEAQSGANFTLLEDDGDCGSSGGGGPFATDLFISEVYDALTGSLSYIEIFNGTNATVNLTAGNYVIRIRTGTSTDNDYPMTGNLTSGDTYILRLGSSSSTCSNFSPNQDLPLASGFNGDDRIYLRKNNADLDYAPNPNHPDAGGSGGSQPGFSQSRNATVTSPSTSYIAGEWTTGANEVCDDLGIAPFVPNGSDVTISSQPLDVDCSALTFSVVASADPSFNATNPYVWRYNEPGTDAWELVSSLNGSNGLMVLNSGSSTITITGNTADLLNYQFYVDITADGTLDCTKASNAAQYTYESRAFYRTKANGNWTDAANWEMSDSEGGTYAAACQYPTDRGSSKVNILSGDSILLDSVAITIDELDVNSNGVLAIGTEGELFINNGNTGGADFLINGTYYDQASSPDGIEFNDDATWQIFGNATIIKTNTSSVSNYSDNYEPVIDSIPATANWIYRREGTNEVSVVTTGMHYPNLTFENNGVGDYDPTDPQRYFQGSSSTAVVKGNLDIGGAGTSGYVVRTNNVDSVPILVNGSLIIRAGSTLTNNDVGGTDEGTGIEVKGDLTIEGSLNFTASTIAGRGQLVLSGNDDQIGIGDGNVVSVNEFEINKPSGDFYTEFSLNVNREAQFIAGIYEINDLASNPADVEFSSSATATGMSNASFVDGTVAKFGSVDFDFPIGDTDTNGSSFYQPLSMFDLPITGGYSARYYAEENPNAGLYYDGESNNPNDFQEIGNCDYWTFDSLSGGNPKFGVTYTNLDSTYCNKIGAPEFVRISRWNNFAWDEIPSANNGNRIDLDQAVGVAVGSAYGQFVLSGPEVGNLNILPITLLSFTAEAKDGLVHTNWITASELNNDFFTVERSKDAEHWEEVGRKDGAGNSNMELAYAFADDDPYSGISYYRLRQTDFDGATTLSAPRAVEILQGNDFGLDRVYRGQDGLSLIYRATAPYVVVEIYDLLGKRIHGELIENYGNGFSTIHPDLAKGAYILRLSHGSKMDSEKFVW